jgi:hypothetical protein
MGMRMWKKLSIKKRLLVLAGIGFVVGNFIQGEVDTGHFPGVFTFIGIGLACLIVQQAWADGAKKAADQN